MKHEKHSWNIYFCQWKYLNKLNLKKNFQALKSDLPIYKLHKVFACPTDFPKVIGKSHKFVKLFTTSTNFTKFVSESHKLFKVVHKFYELYKVVGKFYEVCEVLSHFY